MVITPYHLPSFFLRKLRFLTSSKPNAFSTKDPSESIEIYLYIRTWKTMVSAHQLVPIYGMEGNNQMLYVIYHLLS